MLFRMSVIPWWIAVGPYLTYPAFSLSSPTLLPFFIDFAAFSISLWVKGFSILDGGMGSMFSLTSFVNILVKCAVIDFTCSSSDPATEPSWVKRVRVFFSFFLFSSFMAMKHLLESSLCFSISSSLWFSPRSSITWMRFLISFIVLFRSFLIHFLFPWIDIFQYLLRFFSVSLIALQVFCLDVWHFEGLLQEFLCHLDDII